MPMLYPPKPIRSHEDHDPELRRVEHERERAARRRRMRLYEIEFFSNPEASPPGSRAALEDMDHPAHASSAAVLLLDPRLASAINAAANGWVIERYR